MFDIHKLVFIELAVSDWTGLKTLLELTGFRLNYGDDKDLLAIGVYLYAAASSLDKLIGKKFACIY